MKLYKGLFYTLAAAALLTGCAKEDPFPGPDEAMGMLMTRCLAPTLTNPEGLEAATRAAVPSTDDFKVVITRQGTGRSATDPGTVEYKYSEMPEVLTLPVGDYKVYAHHGDNLPAAWDAPYYYGESTFGIEASKVTDDVDPIVAKLANVRVTIVFHESLKGAMSSDSKVEVKVGDQGTMTFLPGETRSAYFKYVNKSQTLAATFTGNVDGSDVIQTQTKDNVAPGNHYKITFRLHGIEDDAPGHITGTVTVDATVEQENMNYTIDGEQDDYLTDDMRPTQGGNEDPTPPDTPTPDDPVKVKPYAVPLDPAVVKTYTDSKGIVVDCSDYDMIDLSKVNEVTDHLFCGWRVVSDADGGFTEFKVDIISDTLTAEELDGVGLQKNLDLINPGEFEATLAGLGFPVNLGGKKEAEFNITGFLGLMAILGPGDHVFKLTVADANGTSIIELKLHTN